MSRANQRRCSIFNCDRRHGNFCCADCGYKTTNCKNPCLNGPERCGLLDTRPSPDRKKVKNGD